MNFRDLATYFQSRVHEQARRGGVTPTTHRSFIASRLLAGLLALCTFAVYLSMSAMPSVFGALGLIWFLASLGLAFYRSRTAQVAGVEKLSALNLAALVTYCAWLTGGLSSALLPWLVAVPLEAGFGKDRRAVLFASGAVVFGLMILAVSSAAGTTPALLEQPAYAAAFALLGLVSAVAYAASLVLMLQRVPNESEQTIGTEEACYRLLAENVNDMLTLHDERDRVVFASGAAQEFLSAPVTSVLGDGLFDHVHVADRPAYLSALSRCRTEQKVVVVEFRLRRGRRDAAERYAWVEMRCQPAAQVEGAKPSGIVASTRDISSHKEQEDIMRLARHEAESASQAKTEFLASMSHELRTPLNAIIGFSEILDRELFGKLGQERYRDYAGLIHESGEHLLGVVNEILDMSKIEAGKFTIVTETFDAAPLVTSCCEIMRHTAESKGLALTIDIAEGLPEFIADKRACKQMLLNMISNAIKFTKTGGWVRVSASVQDASIVFAVSDNGVGIAPQDLPHLGNPFVQASTTYDREQEGAGLGLSVVRGLAQLHGGTLTLDSTLGQGTVATISLPLDDPSKPVLPRLDPRQVFAA